MPCIASDAGDPPDALNHCRNVWLASIGSSRRLSMPAYRSRISLPIADFSGRFVSGASGDASLLKNATFPIILSRSEYPFFFLYLSRNSYFSFAMSTLDGHSALHPLHSRHRSITPIIRSLVSASCGSAPDIAPRNAFARPRVECSSSRVTMYDGHIVPPRTLRHAP